MSLALSGVFACAGTPKAPKGSSSASQRKAMQRTAFRACKHNCVNIALAVLLVRHRDVRHDVRTASSPPQLCASGAPLPPFPPPPPCASVPQPDPRRILQIICYVCECATPVTSSLHLFAPCQQSATALQQSSVLLVALIPVTPVCTFCLRFVHPLPVLAARKPFKHVSRTAKSAIIVSFILGRILQVLPLLLRLLLTSPAVLCCHIIPISKARTSLSSINVATTWNAASSFSFL